MAKRRILTDAPVQAQIGELDRQVEDLLPQSGVAEGNDWRQLETMRKEVFGQMGAPTEAVVGTGYENFRLQSAVEARGVRLLCPPQPGGNAKEGVKATGWRKAGRAYRQQRKARWETAAGRARYRRRKTTIEPGFSLLKAGMGFTRIQRRGLAQVKNEWRLVSLAFDCRRLARRWA